MSSGRVFQSLGCYFVAPESFVEGRSSLLAILTSFVFITFSSHPLANNDNDKDDDDGEDNDEDDDGSSSSSSYNV